MYVLASWYSIFLNLYLGNIIILYIHLIETLPLILTFKERHSNNYNDILQCIQACNGHTQSSTCLQVSASLRVVQVVIKYLSTFMCRDTDLFKPFGELDSNYYVVETNLAP